MHTIASCNQHIMHGCTWRLRFTLHIGFVCCRFQDGLHGAACCMSHVACCLSHVARCALHAVCCNSRCNLIRSFVQPERLTGENAYACAACTAKRDELLASAEAEGAADAPEKENGAADARKTEEDERQIAEVSTFARAASIVLQATALALSCYRRHGHSRRVRPCAAPTRAHRCLRCNSAGCDEPRRVQRWAECAKRATELKQRKDYAAAAAATAEVLAAACY